MWRQQELAAKQRNFDAKLVSVEASFARLRRSVVTKRLLKVRNKAHAHKEIAWVGGTPRLRTVADFGLRVRDVRHYLGRVRPLILDLELIVNGASFILDEIDRQNVAMARDFWMAPAQP